MNENALDLISHLREGWKSGLMWVFVRKFSIYQYLVVVFSLFCHCPHPVITPKINYQDLNCAIGITT